MFSSSSSSQIYFLYTLFAFFIFLHFLLLGEETVVSVDETEVLKYRHRFGQEVNNVD